MKQSLVMNSKLHRSFIMFLIVCAVCVLSLFDISAQVSQSENEYVGFPQEEWKKYEIPEAAGWSSELLKVAKEYYESTMAASVMVVYKGNVVANWGDVDKKFMCHSIRKSFLSVLYGVYVDKGKIDLEKTIKELKIRDKNWLTKGEKRAKIVDLMKSRSGIYHLAAYEGAAAALSKPKRGTYKPGEHWHYNNWDFNTLGTIFNQTTGKDLFESFEKDIATPIGMETFDREKDTYYHYEKEVSNHPAYPFLMSGKDMARFGLLVLNKGSWNGNQIVSKKWIEESTQSYSENGYGYMWWIEDQPVGKVIVARGVGGHSIEIVPSLDVVVVIRTNTFNREGISGGQRNRLLGLILSARTSNVDVRKASLIDLN